MAEMTRVLRRIGWRILAVLAAVKSGVCAALPVAAFALAALAVQTVAFAPEAFANGESQCRDKGWTVGTIGADKHCPILINDASLSGSQGHFNFCLLGNQQFGRRCAVVFGSNFQFPQKPTDGSNPRYVFNCGSGKVPSGANTIGATKCCPTGQAATPDTGNQCVNPADLLDEIQKARGSASPARVASLLSAGGNPNGTINGVPALIVAATIGHAEIVSILITAGATAGARLPNSGDRAVPHIAVINDFGSLPLYYSWETALNVLRHFADAVKQSGATYDWTSLGAGYRAIEHFEHRYVRNDPTTGALWPGESVADKQRAMRRMANILLASGDSCRASLPAKVVNHITCTGPLLAEVEKAHGAEDPVAVAEYMEDGGDPEATDSSNRPLLIVAARQGHAKIVSILITAGAKSTVTDPSFYNVNAAIHAATPLTDPGPSLRAARASVLYHFGDALDVVGDTSFDWSYEDDNNNTILDVLRIAEDKNPRPAGEDVDILYQMADYVAAQGGTCNNAASDRRICGPCPFGQGVQNKVCAACTGGEGVLTNGNCGACPAGQTVQDGVCFCSAGGEGFRDDGTCGACPVGQTVQNGVCVSADAVLIAEVQETSPNLTVVLRALDGDADADITTSAGVPALIVAATLGHAEIVSILITAGANAGALKNGRAAPHLIAINDFGSAPLYYSWGTALNVLRHFADAVNQTPGATYTWNLADGDDWRAIEHMNHRYTHANAVWPDESAADKRAAMIKMADILLANGDSCRPNRAASWHTTVTCTGSCDQGEGVLSDNTCGVCTSGEGVLASGFCGVCPSGEGVLTSGFCGVCTGVQTVQDGVCACPAGQVLQDGVCACPAGQVLQDGVCACPAGQLLQDGVCAACPAGEVPLIGECGKCTSEQISFNGNCIADALPSEVQGYFDTLETFADAFEGIPSAAPRAEAIALRAMQAAILAKHAGDPNFYELVAVYDTGGASYSSTYYTNLIAHANTNFGANTFSRDNDNELARILTFVPAIPPASEKCRSAGWTFLADGVGSCGIPLTLSGGAASSQCNLSSSDSPQCDAVFGSTVNYFPAPTLSANGATLRFVYNCDPDGSKNEIPATSNTIGATECACAAGHELIGDACVPNAIAVRAQKCADAGRELSAADGVSCAAAITLSGGTLYSKCHFSGGSKPQCADVFGAELEFPAASVDGPFVYNCDPGDVTGLVPATSNTVAATACACPAGEEFFRDECIVPPHAELIEAVQAAEPELAVIRALLDQGARANITLAGGLPLVFSAATLFHAEVVSVLVTAGADPETRHGVVDANEQVDIGGPISASIPEHILAYGTLHVGKAQVMIHFADAARIVAATSTVSVAFQWDDPARFAGGLFVLAEQAYMESGPAGREEMSFIGGYLLDQGAQCDGVTQGTAAHTALCLSRRSCALAASSVTVVSSCGVCAGNPLRSGEGDSCVPACGGGQFAGEAAGWGERQCQCADGEGLIGGSCVLSTVAAEARLCEGAGWALSPDGGGACGIPVTVSGEGGSQLCHLTGPDSPQCSSVFGATVNYFPAPVTSSIGVTLSFVYDCDPEGGRGLIPATVNTVGATACVCANAEQSVRRGVCQCPVGEGVVADGTCDTCPNGQGIRSDGTCGVCPVGQSIVGAVCLPGAVMNQCVTVGWSFSAADGGSCGVLLTLAGGESVDRCYVSGELDPQCEDVFGGTVNYFPAPTLAADGATLRFVYDCDPKGENGLIPATANTILATECGCFGDTAARGGGCVPLSGDLGTLSDKVLCGAFGGTVQIATGGEVCSGMDENDTFCIMDAAEVDDVRAFPCRGLFKHLQACNLMHKRKALNPFFCGAKCGEEMEAVGKDCVQL